MPASLRSRPALSLLALTAVAGVAAAPAAEPVPFGGLEWLGSAELPPQTRHAGRPVGGLSGLAWNAEDGTFWALSDDRGEFGPVRLYRLRVDLADGRLEAGDVEVAGELLLADLDGRPFAARGLDPEGIALGGGSLYLSSEGDADAGIAPFVAEAGLDGRVRRYFELPEAYLPAGGERGVRWNLGFESLALSRDGDWLYTATENALVQDGLAADVGVASLARILRFPLDRPAAPEEIAYRVEGVRAAPREPSAFRINGLNDLVDLGGGRLLALERQFVDGVGNEVRLYRGEWGRATPVGGRAALGDGAVEPAPKELLLDFAALGVELDNFEGMALGPRLADGRRLLLVVSDDNFNPRWQRTLFFAFAVDEAPATIARIQGAGHRSPLEGRWVFDVEGVVTAIVDTRSLAGFWIESERPDGDPATSEGLFVEWEGASTLAPGRRVRLHGRVIEAAADPRQLPVTRLAPTAVVPLDGEAELPPPPRLGRDLRVPFTVEDDALERFEPERDALDFWESLEGMRLELPGGVVIGPTLRYGELVLLPEGAEAPRRTTPGGVRLEPAGAPRERMLVSGRIHRLPQASVGARVAGPVRGVVHYDFSSYKLIATEPLAVEPAAAARCGAPTRLRAEPGRLTVASFNAENLSAAGPPERFEEIGRVVAERLGAPAILALQEIQDDSGPADDGVVTSARTLTLLERAITAAGGPRYEPIWIDPEEGREGGQPGGNIRVALLVDPLRARIARRGDPGPLDGARIFARGGSPELLPSPARVAPTAPAFTLGEGEGVRRSLAVELEVDGEPLFLVVNHWSSKWDDDRDFGARQPPAKPTGAKRRAQAEVVRTWVEEILAIDPEARVAVLGDLNEPEWAPGVSRLAEPPLENLILRLPEPERYTFNFEGAGQVLDHVVVSPALAGGAEIEILHLNSDCPDSLRTSDHDPVVVRFRLR